MNQRQAMHDFQHSDSERVCRLGIYDYTSYLFLDFHNGTPTVYLKYFSENENLEYSFTGYTTTEIIFAILELTIFSGKPKRNRS